MRDLVPELGDRPVLVSGRGDVLNMARAYGFTKALHARELGAAMPTATPFTTYPPAPQREQQQQQQQQGRDELGQGVGSTEGWEHASWSWVHVGPRGSSGRGTWSREAKAHSSNENPHADS